VNILVCPLSDGGYLYPALAAGRELRRRGHTVSVLGRAGAAPFAAEAGLPFTAAGEYSGRRAFSVAWWGRSGPAQYVAVVRAARETRADLLLTSVLCNGALVAAEALELPVVVTGLAAHLWPYRSGGAGEPPHGGRTRENRAHETRLLLDATRERAGLAGRAPRWGDDPLCGDALLLRGAPALEWPGARLPARVHHVGPLAWEPAADPAELALLDARLARSGKPVVYVHLGRFFDGENRWPRLNAAFTGGRFQAVVERGRSGDPRPAPGADITIVREPWMGPLIDRAGLVLTSGTSAPALSALLRGRSLAVLPNGSEQPLLSAALVRAGVAVRVPAGPGASAAEALDAAWEDAALRDRARALGRALATTESASRAADVVEGVVRASTNPAPAPARVPAQATAPAQAPAPAPAPREDHGYAIT
jgi:UDP:flavonoid glycosyltransferase YjiC (YdhE family)